MHRSYPLAFSPFPVYNSNKKGRCFTLDIPHDPIILLSYVNTKLRDHYATLEEFCQACELDEQELRSALSAVDYHYDEITNQFV